MKDWMKHETRTHVMCMAYCTGKYYSDKVKSMAECEAIDWNCKRHEWDQVDSDYAM